MRVRQWRACAIHDPDVPCGGRVERANRFENKGIARATIVLSSRELFFNDRGNIGTGCHTHAYTFLRLTSTAHRAFDLCAP